MNKRMREIQNTIQSKSAEAVSYTEGEGYTKQWDVNGETVTFTVAKA